MAVCVNKADINPGKTEEIKRYCEKENLVFAGSIPYDPLAVQAVNRGLSIADIPCPSGKAVERIFRKTFAMLNTDPPA
jgi:MinD superfamily P-loop ATPase